MFYYDKVKPRLWWRLLVTLVLILSIDAMSDSGDSTMVAGPVILLLFVWIPYFLKLNEARDALENIDKYGKDVVEKDFAAARAVGESRIRLGKEFLYLMKGSYVVAYKDVKVLQIGDAEDTEGNVFHVLYCNERKLMSIAYPYQLEFAYQIISSVISENPEVKYRFVDADAPNAIAERIIQDNPEAEFWLEAVSSTEKQLVRVKSEG